MKGIRSLTILLGLSLVLVALGATGAKAQALSTARFTGSLNLPYEVHWGTMTLPAGRYTVQIGDMDNGGFYIVEITGEAQGSPHGFVPVLARNSTAAAQNLLDCVRKGDTHVVRAMELPALGESVTFPAPRRSQLLARQLKNKANAQLEAEAMPIQRIPIKLNEK